MAFQGTTFGRCPLEPRDRDWEMVRSGYRDGNVGQRRDEGLADRRGLDGVDSRLSGLCAFVTFRLVFLGEAGVLGTNVTDRGVRTGRGLTAG